MSWLLMIVTEFGLGKNGMVGEKLQGQRSGVEATTQVHLNSLHATFYYSSAGRLQYLERLGISFIHIPAPNHPPARDHSGA